LDKMIRRFSLLVACIALIACAPRLPAQDQGVSVSASSGPDVGREAPSFTLDWAGRDTAGTGPDAYSLWRDRGKVVVLAFYPRDFTRTDSLQLSLFRDRYDQLFGPDVVVLGVSVDSIRTHRRFAAALNLPFRLLSDPGLKVAARYGSKDTGGIALRTVYVVGRDGRVAYRDQRFRPTDKRAVDDLAKAVRAAVKRPPR
jgi:peroxiredoxin Q/BCP